MDRLKDKVIVITGATKGIGEAAAYLFAKEGAKLIINGRNIEDGCRIENKIRKNGSEAYFFKADISNAKEVEKMFYFAVEKFGKLDVLYNNAGVWIKNEDNCVHELSEENFEKIIDLNLKGTFLCCKYGLQKMLSNKNGGSIINTSSILALIGFGDRSAYEASKGGIISLTKSIAARYGQNKIRANVICPGSVDTPMIHDVIEDPKIKKATLEDIPLGIIGEPKHIAYLAIFLASDESEFTTGSIFVVDGGQINV